MGVPGVVGVLLGTAISYLVFTKVWPVSVTGRIEPAIARLLALFKRAADCRPGARQLLMNEAAAEAVELGRSLDLAEFEPFDLRRSPDWIEGRRRLLARTDGLETSLLLARPEATGDASEWSIRARLADLTADFAAARLGPAHSATKSVVSVSLDGG